MPPFHGCGERSGSARGHTGARLGGRGHPAALPSLRHSRSRRRAAADAGRRRGGDAAGRAADTATGDRRGRPQGAVGDRRLASQILVGEDVGAATGVLGDAPAQDPSGAGVRRVGDRPVRPAEQRLDGVALRAGAGAERRGRRRAAVRVRRHPALWRSADGLHVARRSLRLSHDRPGDSLLPHAVATAGGDARTARSSVHRRGPDDRRRHGDGAVPVRRRQPAWCRALGCDASGDVLRLVRRGARHQHAGGGRGGSSLPLQPRRQRAPADPHGALYRRTGRAGLCHQGRTADRGAADRHDAAAPAGSDRDRSAAADPAAGGRPGLRGRRGAGARAARRAAAQPAVRAGEPHADRTGGFARGGAGAVDREEPGRARSATC